MCGRYTLTASNKPELLGSGLGLADRFNIAPQSNVLVETDVSGLVMMPWSLSPKWAQSPMNLFNARLETLDEKPSFRGASRCVFLADGWYEWQRINNGKQPWYHHRNGKLIRFAGVYHRGSGCAIVTTKAQEAIEHIHHRQPVLLSGIGAAAWLEGDSKLEPASAPPISCHPVGLEVNNARVDHPNLVEPSTDRIATSPQGRLL